MNRAFAILLASTLTTACGGRTDLLPTAEPDGSTEGSSVGEAGGNPLEGTWLYTTPTGPSLSESITFGPGGALTLTLTAADCSGQETLSGVSWTATATQVTVSGSASCSGSLDCLGGPGGCGTAPTAIETTCGYALSNNDDVLTLGPCVATTGNPITTNTSGTIALTRK
jgi:hypothetical protein